MLSDSMGNVVVLRINLFCTEDLKVSIVIVNKTYRLSLYQISTYMES